MRGAREARSFSASMVLARALFPVGARPWWSAGAGVAMAGALLLCTYAGLGLLGGLGTWVWWDGVDAEGELTGPRVRWDRVSCVVRRGVSSIVSTGSSGYLLYPPYRVGIWVSNMEVGGGGGQFAGGAERHQKTGGKLQATRVPQVAVLAGWEAARDRRRRYGDRRKVGEISTLTPTMGVMVLYDRHEAALQGKK